MNLMLGDMGEAGNIPAAIRVAVPSAGPTWGIEGPLFLEWYLSIGLILAAVAFSLRLFTGGLFSFRKRVDPHSLPPLDLAYLSGGPFHAVAISHWLLQTRNSGGQSPEERQFLDANWHDPLLQAVAGPAGIRGATVKGCLDDPSVQAQLEVRHRCLATKGLLRTRRVMRVFTYLKFAAIAYLGLGLLRAIAGFLNGRDTDYLVGTLIAGVLAFFILIARVRTVTTPGTRLLDALRAENRDLSPRHKTSYSGVSPARVTLGAAVFGTAGLWVAAPAYAAAMGIPAAGASSATGGSYYGGDSGSSSYSGGSDGGSSGGSGCGGGGCGG